MWYVAEAVSRQAAKDEGLELAQDMILLVVLLLLGGAQVDGSRGCRWCYCCWAGHRETAVGVVGGATAAGRGTGRGSRGCRWRSWGRALSSAECWRRRP